MILGRLRSYCCKCRTVSQNGDESAVVVGIIYGILKNKTPEKAIFIERFRGKRLILVEYFSRVLFE